MNKDDVKAIFVIFFILLLISAIALLGINIYLNIMELEGNNKEVLYQGDTLIIPDEENNNNADTSKKEDKILNQIEFSSTSNESTQTNITTKEDKYYYKQLDFYAKLIYDKFKENKENLKTGTYKIEFGNEFNELLEQESGSEVLQKAYQSGMETFLYDNPDVFYIAPTKMYINIQTTKKIFTTIYEVFIDSGENENYFADGYTSKQQILNYESQIEQEVEKILLKTEGKNTYKKIQIIHDYLVDTITYDQTISKNNIYNIYGALVNKEAVCEGYAKAFKYLMEKIGIESVVIIGTATDSEGNTQNHAWNYLQFNNAWYAVDVTWDDPVIIGFGVLSNAQKYKYFLKGSVAMKEDHTEQYSFVENGKEYTHPILSSKDYE